MPKMYHNNVSTMATWPGLALHPSVLRESREVAVVQLKLIHLRNLQLHFQSFPRLLLASSLPPLSFLLDSIGSPSSPLEL